MLSKFFSLFRLFTDQYSIFQQTFNSKSSEQSNEGWECQEKLKNGNIGKEKSSRVEPFGAKFPADCSEHQGNDDGVEEAYGRVLRVSPVGEILLPKAC